MAKKSMMFDVKDRNEVKISQLGLILLMIMAGSKFITIPGLIAKDAQNNGWLSFIILFALDFAAMMCLLCALKNNKNRLSCEQILSTCLSKVVSKIIFIFLFFFFLIRTMNLMLSLQNIFSTTLTLKTNWVGFSVPILIYFYFSMRLGMKATARVTELIAAAVVISAVLMIVFSIQQAKFDNLYPILADGIMPVLKGSISGSFWFSDSLFMLFFSEFVVPDKLEKKQHWYRTPVVAFCVVAGLTIILYIVFYALYGSTSWMQEVAMEKVSQFNNALTSQGRLDWLTLIIWFSSIFIKLTILSWCAMRSFDFVFGIKNEHPSHIGYFIYSNIIFALPLYVSIQDLIQNIIVDGYGKYVTWVFQYILPWTFPIMVYAVNKNIEKVRKPKGIVYCTNGSY